MRDKILGLGDNLKMIIIWACVCFFDGVVFAWTVFLCGKIIWACVTFFTDYIKNICICGLE